MAGSGTAHLRDADSTLLRVENMVVEFPIGQTGQTVHAVSGVSLDLIEGETLGLVGESGCGKSTTGKAIMQVPKPTSGSVTLDKVELTQLDDDTLRRTRPVLQMIFQDPISALNPRRPVRDIIAEPLVVWWEEEDGRPATSIWFERFGRLYQRVGRVVTEPLRYVVPLAGIALLLWIISEAAEDRRFEDALGWTQVPAQIIGFPALIVLVAIAATLFGLGLIWALLGAFVPFGVVSKVLGRVPPNVGRACAVFSAAVWIFLVWRTWNSVGVSIEDGVSSASWITWLVRGFMMLMALISIAWLVRSMTAPPGSGATSVAAALASMTFLQLFYISGLDGKAKLAVLVGAAVVDYAVFRVLRRQTAIRRDELRDRSEPRVREMLETVGINPDQALDRKPFEFSGGQAQRLSIARALIMDPKVIICDEPVSALDVSVQAQILNLLEEMKERYGLTLVFIAHDLAVVKNVSDRVAVMYLGKICEVANPDVLYAAPAHPYSQLLIDAIPHPDPNLSARGAEEIGDLPSPINPPSGCRFRTRCPHAQDRCSNEEPTMREIGPDRYVACHFPLIGEPAP